MKTNPCKFLKRFVSLSLLGFALLALPVLPVLAEDAPQMPDHGLCAHRGDVANFPENTVIAFQAAAEKGAEMIEFDICRTKDGKFVVMHDFTVDRTTNGHGKIADLTFDEIRKLDAGCKKAPQFAGTQVPTPEEVLDCLPRNIWINVHLKGDVPGDVIARMIKEKGRLHQAFLAANKKQIEAARQAVPEILTDNMERQGGDCEAYCQATMDHHCEFLQLTSLPAPETMKKLREAGIKINYFPCNSVDFYRQLRTAGVDFPLTDKLEELQKVKAEMDAAQQ